MRELTGHKRRSNFRIIEAQALARPVDIARAARLAHEFETLRQTNAATPATLLGPI